HGARRPADGRAAAHAAPPRGRSRAIPFLRADDGRDPRRARRCGTTGGARAGAGGDVTKQREARERVLDMIERLEIGQAIPSERQLSADLGFSRLTVRAALDELVREGYLIRRR